MGFAAASPLCFFAPTTSTPFTEDAAEDEAAAIAADASAPNGQEDLSVGVVSVDDKFDAVASLSLVTSLLPAAGLRPTSDGIRDLAPRR
jgi:hypothetical protein